MLTVEEPDSHTGFPYLMGQSSPSLWSRHIPDITGRESVSKQSVESGGSTHITGILSNAPSNVAADSTNDMAPVI